MQTRYKRIMIFGRPGSGKSTFAHSLHAATGIPLYHLDKYFFVDNWVERKYSDFLEIESSLIEKPSWIIDGNATRSLHVRWLEADLVIYLNYPRWLCYWRIVKRLFQRRILSSNNNLQFDDRGHNCKEMIRWKLIKYMFSFDDRVRTTIHLMHEVQPNTPFYEITSDAQLEKLVQELF